MNHEPIFGEWLSASADIFWREIASSDHVVQVYDNDGILLDALTGFVDSTIAANENAVVIATNSHLSALERRLQTYGHHIETLISENKFFPIDAEDLLTEFMVAGQPDEAQFKKIATRLFEHATINQRKFRAFGEMVAVLWGRGNKTAALRLEHLWNDLLDREQFCLFCAYPKKIFNAPAGKSSLAVCSAHTKMISGSEKQLTHVFYQEIGRAEVQ